MCFSEKLVERAAGYQGESGYVLVGYKTVVRAGKMLLPCRSFAGGVRRLVEISDFYNRPTALNVDISQELVVEIIRCLFDLKTPVFAPRQLMEVDRDEHPFHVGSNEVSAVENNSANPFGCENRYVFPSEFEVMGYEPPSDEWQIRAMEKKVKRVPKLPGVLVRVLVPENAVDATNHVHAMMIIPPGEKETDEDVRACERWNATHRPMPRLVPKTMHHTKRVGSRRG